VPHWFTQESASDVSFDLARTRQAPACSGDGLEAHRVNRCSAAFAPAVLITPQAVPRVKDILQGSAKVLDQSVADFPCQRVAGGSSGILTGPSRLAGIVLVGSLVERDRSELIDRTTQTLFLGVKQPLDPLVGGLATTVFRLRVHAPNVNQAGGLE
jgi:hypothetical protein